jgi:hypothetical protein
MDIRRPATRRNIGGVPKYGFDCQLILYTNLGFSLHIVWRQLLIVITVEHTHYNKKKKKKPQYEEEYNGNKHKLRL